MILTFMPCSCLKGVCVCACIAGDMTLLLELDSSDSELTLVPAKHPNKRSGSLCCRASDCSATFRRYAQLATHYTDSHPCNFGPPRDKNDLAIYNRGMSASAQQSTTQGKRKRSTSTSQQWRPTKKAKSKYVD